MKTLIPHRLSSIGFRARVAILMMPLLALSFAGPGFAGEEASPEIKKEAGRAFDALIDSANDRFAQAQKDKTTGIELELLEEFESFARKYPGTEEAIIAWMQSAMLAQMVNEYDRAEKDLNIADSLTDDPAFQVQIDRQLASMKIRPDMPAPNFSVTTVDGRTLRPEDLRGKVFLLDFWATWCAPCIAELPNLKKVHAEYSPRGFEVVSISLDSEREYFDQFIREQEMNWTHVYNEAQPEGMDLADRYGIVSIPRMILVDEKGMILEGNLRGHDLNEAVEKAVGGER